MIELTATDARKSFFELARAVSEKHEIYRVRHRSDNVVIMSEAEYESLLETMDLLSTPRFREGFDRFVSEVAADETVGFEEVFGEPQ
jgi:antitoxin YefM